MGGTTTNIYLCYACIFFYFLPQVYAIHVKYLVYVPVNYPIIDGVTNTNLFILTSVFYIVIIMTVGKNSKSDHTINTYMRDQSSKNWNTIKWRDSDIFIKHLTRQGVNYLKKYLKSYFE